MTTITFDQSAVELVLENFEREVDRDGYIINPETGRRETTDNGEEIHKSDFAGLERGSIIFLSDDFNDIIDHVKRRRE